MQIARTMVIAPLVATIVGGCAGSGGGSDEEFEGLMCVFMGVLPCLFQPVEQTATPSWTSIRGSGAEVSMGYSPAGSGNIQVNDGAASTFQLSYAEAANRADGTFWYFQAGSFRLDSIGVRLPGQPGLELVARSVQWGNGNATPFVEPSAERYSLVAPNRHVGVAADPRQSGWSYQSFGIWNVLDSTGGRIGAASLGDATPASAVPAAGTATFSGKLAGFYVSPGGQGSIASARASLAANFSSRSLTFASSGTTTTRDLSTAVAATAHDLRGSLTYAPGSGSFSGTLSNVGGTLSGASSGRFYGPAAQELGGTFTLRSGTTTETFIGAYGAKR